MRSSGGLLIATDFTKSDGSGPETVRLLHASGSGLIWEDNNKVAQEQFRNAWKPTTHIISLQEQLGTYRCRRLPRSLGGELLTGGLPWKTKNISIIRSSLRSPNPYRPPVDLRTVCCRGSRQRRRRIGDSEDKNITDLGTGHGGTVLTVRLLFKVRWRVSHA